MEDDNLNNLISSLESLCSSLQETASHNPTNLDSKLGDAASQASRIIKSTFPPEQQATWLSELKSLTDVTPQRGSEIHSESQKSPEDETRSDAKDELSCGCDAPDSRSKERLAECIYGCGALFCSPTCRKKNARGHARVCSVLERKKILRSLGLAADEELF